ncbi:hypothetical protein VFPPC_15744 [Pochonia chlamydosporia 170]|uniref:Uncharacterized protein n=1 Tax=Pochonia chlamydosporia 170 TaxID=1380566 RepID=A0A179FS70_METCM|nr:hypothetical protein VFPPC_15744 [Pochonia chlamydosporia 170]OAQ67859.1 hypothetical protein VFPPC_15744 [Pochonia chlamydosporia 170]
MKARLDWCDIGRMVVTDAWLPTPGRNGTGSAEYTLTMNLVVGIGRKCYRTVWRVGRSQSWLLDLWPVMLDVHDGRSAQKHRDMPLLRAQRSWVDAVSGRISGCTAKPRP